MTTKQQFSVMYTQKYHSSSADLRPKRVNARAFDAFKAKVQRKTPKL